MTYSCYPTTARQPCTGIWPNIFPFSSSAVSMYQTDYYFDSCQGSIYCAFLHLYKHIQSSLLKWIGFGKLKVQHKRREERTVWYIDYGSYCYRCQYNVYVYLQRLLARLSLFSQTSSLTTNKSLLSEKGLSKLCRSVTGEDMHVRICVFKCKHTCTFLLECFLRGCGIFAKQNQNGYQLFLWLPQFFCTNYTH